MSWGSDDWHTWLREDDAAPFNVPSCLEALSQVLRRIPGRDRMTVADLGCRTGGPFLVDLFARVVHLDAAAGLDGTLGAAPRRFDVVTAVDSIDPSRLSEFDLVLRQVRRSLTEGGIFLGTFVASTGSKRPFEMRLCETAGDLDSARLHEIELQYRLRRAGFEGLRLRRFRGRSPEPDRILCMAVRRTCS